MSKPKVQPVKFVMRMPPKLHQRLKRSAKKNNTSMNRQILAELEGDSQLTQILAKLDEFE